MGYGGSHPDRTSNKRMSFLIKCCSSSQRGATILIERVKASCQFISYLKEEDTHCLQCLRFHTPVTCQRHIVYSVHTMDRPTRLFALSVVLCKTLITTKSRGKTEKAKAPRDSSLIITRLNGNTVSSLSTPAAYDCCSVLREQMKWRTELWPILPCQYIQQSPQHRGCVKEGGN